MSILVYFRACPLTSILSPEGERKFERTRNLVRQCTMSILVYYHACPVHTEGEAETFDENIRQLFLIPARYACPQSE